MTPKCTHQGGFTDLSHLCYQTQKQSLKNTQYESSVPCWINHRGAVALALYELVYFEIPCNSNKTNSRRKFWMRYWILTSVSSLHAKVEGNTQHHKETKCQDSCSISALRRANLRLALLDWTQLSGEQEQP